MAAERQSEHCPFTLEIWHKANDDFDELEYHDSVSSDIVSSE